MNLESIKLYFTNLIKALFNQIKEEVEDLKEEIEIDVKGKTLVNAVYKVKDRKTPVFIPKGSEYVAGPTVKKTSKP